MNKLHEAIIVGIYRELERTKTGPMPTWESVGGHPGKAIDIWNDAQKRITPLDLAAFIGREPTGSERTMASRAYKALEAAGYIERLPSAWSDRTTHILLTDEGERIARSFLGLTEATGHDADPPT